MIIAFVGDSYNRNLAEFYLMSAYKFVPINLYGDLLEGVKKIFNLKDTQVYGEEFYSDELSNYGNLTGYDLFNCIEAGVLTEVPDYYEKFLITRIEQVDDLDNRLVPPKFLITNLANNTELFSDRDDFFVIGLNCPGDLQVDFKEEDDLLDWLDRFLIDKGIEKPEEF